MFRRWFALMLFFLGTGGWAASRVDDVATPLAFFLGAYAMCAFVAAYVAGCLSMSALAEGDA